MRTFIRVTGLGIMLMVLSVWLWRIWADDDTPLGSIDYSRIEHFPADVQGLKRDQVPAPVDEAPPVPEPDPAFTAKAKYRVIETSVSADPNNNLVIIKYPVVESWTSGSEDFPRFSFEPMVGDFVLSDAATEYKVVKRSYGWIGKPHRSSVTLTIWLEWAKPHRSTK